MPARTPIRLICPPIRIARSDWASVPAPPTSTTLSTPAAPHQRFPLGQGQHVPGLRERGADVLAIGNETLAKAQDNLAALGDRAGAGPLLASAIEARLATLEREREEMRDHRTQVRTLLSLAGAAAIAVTLGAVTVRDTTLATAARLAPLEARAAALEAAAGRRDADDRGTRELARAPRLPSLTTPRRSSHAR